MSRPLASRPSAPAQPPARTPMPPCVAPPDFESQLLAAILAATDDGVAPTMPAFAALPGFAVYRNSWRRAAIEALEANFPAVVRLVGADWFRSLAAHFAERSPPDRPVLAEYGRKLPDFLADLPSTAHLPWLADVARLDRTWAAARDAADARAIGATDLAGLPPSALADLRLRPHPAARWRWFDAMPVASIWLASRDPDQAAGDEALAALTWQAEGLLLVRPADAVEAIRIDRAAIALLDATATGATLADAMAAAAAIDAHTAAADTTTDAARRFATLLASGAWTTDDPDTAGDR